MAKFKSALAASTAPRRAAPVVDAAKAAKERAGLAALAQMIAEMIVALFRFIVGGTWGDLKRDVSTARKVAGLARSVGGHALVGVGKGLEPAFRAVNATASAVGATLGALIPRAPAGPRQVADAAVAHDDAASDGLGNPRIHVPMALLGTQLQLAAECRARGNDLAASFHLTDASPAVRAWIEGLTRGQAVALAEMNPWAIEAHLDGTKLTSLPPVPKVVPAAKVGTLSDAEMRAMEAQARRNRRDDRDEIAARARRVLPMEVDHSAGYTAGHSFH
ncbi:hypothetical protein IPV08_10645 [Methylobacterium sp. SD274]|uniref:hypothetical protein n=1 Tax=Methylobacterium sp. SD274 TaxID=2782009 RepID=UPI001A96ED2C|nr:hypothetical protein [Methylobacterium sp. SD274]MBO1020426.1 hypothetical protein [Methylobacterium sp. SD274]